MAKKFTPEYSATDILELFQSKQREKSESRIRSLAETFRQLCKLEHEVVIPEQYQGIAKQVRTPFIRDTWHRVTSSLVAKSPIAHFIPKNEKLKLYRESSGIAERFVMAMVERINKELGIDIYYNLTANQVRDGESILKVVHRPQAWANFPLNVDMDEQDDFKKGVDLPIAWREVDRLNILFEDGEFGDEWVMEYGEFAKPMMRSRYKMVDGPNNRLVNPKNSLTGPPYTEGLAPTDPASRTVRLQFFTPREWHVLIDNTEAPGYPKPNPYAPHLPYFRARTYDSESLLYSLLFLVPRLDELLTMKLTWGALGAYPNPVLETVPSDSIPFGDAGSVTEGKDAFVWKPGKLIDLPIGRKLSFLAPPPVGKDLNDLVGIFKGLIDVAGVPSIMRGIGMSGDSGYLANQLRAAAEMAYKLAAVSGQRQLEKATEFTLWLVKSVIRQTIYVYGWNEINPKTHKPKKTSGQDWLGLSPDKSGNNVANLQYVGPITFQFRPTLPTDEQARAMIALQLTNAAKPLYNRRHALESLLQEEDPDAIMDALAVEDAMETEPLKGMWVERALREAGLLPKAPNPAQQLVGPDGQTPLLPPPPGQIQNIPLENMPQPGAPGMPGITMPMQPAPPQGVPGAPGGRPSGVFPGSPGGPNQ